MLKSLKNAEFSKKLLIFVEVMVIAVFILVCIAVFKGDASALIALITGVFSLASMAFGFYFWKAKNENIRKYAKNLNPQQIRVLAEVAKIFFKDIEPEEGGTDEEDI